jgi:hypothetical protein
MPGTSREPLKVKLGTPERFAEPGLPHSVQVASSVSAKPPGRRQLAGPRVQGLDTRQQQQTPKTPRGEASLAHASRGTIPFRCVSYAADAICIATGHTAALFPSNKRTLQANIFGFDATSRGIRSKDFPSSSVTLQILLHIFSANELREKPS